MASTRTRTRKTATRATTGSSAIRVQKQINQDYVNLIRDYRKLGVALFRKPMTRWVLGGAAVTALVPVFLRMFRNEEVQTFVRDNVEEIRTRIDGIIHSGERELDTLNQ